MNENTNIGLFNISELEYRDLPYPSYSLLSDIRKNGVNVIDGTRNLDINELDGVMVGKLVDNLLTEDKLPDNFYVVKKKPTAKAKMIIKSLAKLHYLLPNKDIIFSEENKDIILKLCNAAGYYMPKKNDTTQKRLDGLINYQDYFDILVKAPQNSFIISDYLYYESKQVVKVLKEEFPWLDNPREGIEIIPQIKLLGEVNGIKIKGMLDFIIIDNINKTITPYDLKTGSYPAKDFIEKGYLGWNYYIQASLYKILLSNEIAKHPIYKDYKVQEFSFMYCSRMDKSTSTTVVNNDMHLECLEGFEFDGNYYTGLNELLTIYSDYKNNK